MIFIKLGDLWGQFVISGSSLEGMPPQANILKRAVFNNIILIDFFGGFRGLWGHMGVLGTAGAYSPSQGACGLYGAAGGLARGSLEAMNWMD